MRKLTLLMLLALTAALPAQAAREKHQSYFSYDDGGTVVRQSGDERDVDARVNLPVYAGDEVITNRRGRSEIRLADGNVLALDRATAVRFRSLLGNYDGEADETVIELRYGKVMFYRADEGRDNVRLDTPNATYFADDEAVFSVEADTRGHDRVSVFDGAIEVRTPNRTTRMRRGEEAEVDDRGLYDNASGSASSADDFERWFLRRAERYGAPASRYLDRSLAYYDDELSRNGSWSYINGYGYGWRPTVSAGWRPYFHGNWARSRNGCLTWVSYEPWGWVPYHYGRWSYEPSNGWFWLPGTGYAPAWVYWWYGNGYVGWAPSGWYDCYRPYYNWAYRPYHRAGLDFGFGFNGRVRVSEIDLRPWTFIDANTIVSNRVDRAALTTDAIRNRISRQGGDYATISGGPARFTREEFRDPAAAINRRWTGESGGTRSPATDMTPFFRRDTELSATVRDRITRTRPADGVASAPGTSAGSTAPSGRGGGTGTIGRGNVTPATGGAPAGSGTTGRVNRGQDRGEESPGRIDRGGSSGRPAVREESSEPRTTPSWRDRVERSGDRPLRVDQPAPRTPESTTPAPREDSWRGRAVRGSAPAREDETPAASERGSDVPRRVIDRIGGARVERPSSREREESPRAPRADSGSRSRERESSSPPARQPSVDRSPSRESSPPPSSSSSGSRDSGSSGRSSSGGGREERVKRDRD